MTSLFRAMLVTDPDGHLDLKILKRKLCCHVARLSQCAAIVAVAFGLSSSMTFAESVRFGDPVVLDKPQPMRATLADGRSIAGAIERWDDEGIDGPIGRHAWSDFKPLEAFRIRKKLIEATGTSQRDRMLDLVAWCWSIDESELAEKAVRDARSLGSSTSAVDEAKVRGVALKATRAARSAAAEREKLKATSPEGEAFPPNPWPTLVASERTVQIDAMKKDVTAKLAAAGRECTPIEGKHALVYSDLGVEDASNRAVLIDEFVAACLGKLGIAPEEPIFWGKLVVIVADGSDRFRLIEASGFRQQTSADDASFAHYDGPKAFVVVRAQTDVTLTTIATLRGVAFAVMHRHISATRLPPWANEGLADWLVASFPRGKFLDEPLRKPGLAFVRDGGSIERVFDLTYDAGSWPGPDRIGRSVGFLVVGFMIERGPQRFQKFIGAVKRGKEWREALEVECGVTPAGLVDRARRYYRTND